MYELNEHDAVCRLIFASLDISTDEAGKGLLEIIAGSNTVSFHEWVASRESTSID